MMDMPDSNNVIYRFVLAIQTWWGDTRIRPPGIRPPGIHLKAHSRILWLSTIINILLYTPSLINSSCRLYVVKS